MIGNHQHRESDEAHDEGCDNDYEEHGADGSHVWQHI